MLRSIEVATLQDCLRDKLSDCTIVTYLYRVAVTTVTEFMAEPQYKNISVSSFQAKTIATCVRIF